MAETPDEILRALADPERLAIAGALAQRARTAAALATDLEIQITRVRKHLNRLTTTGVARISYGPFPYMDLMGHFEQMAREALA